MSALFPAEDQSPELTAPTDSVASRSLQQLWCVCSMCHIVVWLTVIIFSSVCQSLGILFWKLPVKVFTHIFVLGSLNLLGFSY